MEEDKNAETQEVRNYTVPELPDAPPAPDEEQTFPDPFSWGKPAAEETESHSREEENGSFPDPFTWNQEAREASERKASAQNDDTAQADPFAWNWRTDARQEEPYPQPGANDDFFSVNNSLIRPDSKFSYPTEQWQQSGGWQQPYVQAPVFGQPIMPMQMAPQNQPYEQQASMGYPPGMGQPSLPPMQSPPIGSSLPPMQQQQPPMQQGFPQMQQGPGYPYYGYPYYPMVGYPYPGQQYGQQPVYNQMPPYAMYYPMQQQAYPPTAQQPGQPVYPQGQPVYPQNQPMMQAGPPMQQGQPYPQESSPFRQGPSPFGQEAPTFQQAQFQQGPPTFQQPSPFDQGPPAFQQGPPTFQQPSPFQQGPPTFQQPSPFQQGPSPFGQEPSPFQQGQPPQSYQPEQSPFQPKKPYQPFKPSQQTYPISDGSLPQQAPQKAVTGPLGVRPEEYQPVNSHPFVYPAEDITQQPAVPDDTEPKPDISQAPPPSPEPTGPGTLLPEAGIFSMNADVPPNPGPQEPQTDPSPFSSLIAQDLVANRKEYTDEEKKAIKRQYSGFGWGLSLMVLFSQAVPVLLTKFLPNILPDLAGASWLPIAGSYLGMYALGLPLLLLVLRFIPDKPVKRALGPVGVQRFAMLFFYGCALYLIGGCLSGLLLTTFSQPVEPTPETKLVLAAVLVGIAPIADELVFRRLTFIKTGAFGPRMFNIFTSLCFALVSRNVYQIYPAFGPAVVFAFGLGLIFAHLAYRTDGNLLQSWLMHALINLLGVIPLFLPDSWLNSPFYFLYFGIISAAGTACGILLLLQNNKEKKYRYPYADLDAAAPPLRFALTAAGMAVFLILAAASIALNIIYPGGLPL